MRRGWPLRILAAVGLMLASCIVALSIGSVPIPVSEVWKILFHQLPSFGAVIPADWPEIHEQIVLKVRLPRIVLALLAGACLAAAGAGYQGVLRNPLADPFTLGVASGAAVGAAFLILFDLHHALFGQWSIPVVAMATGLASLWIVFRLAHAQGKMRIETLILSGVVMQAFLGSIVSFMVSLSKNTVNEIVFWLMGSLAFRGWPFSLLLLPFLLAGFVLLYRYANGLNLLVLGEREAQHLGLQVERAKLVVLTASTCMAAAAVSVTGIIGFVGLVVPHLVRLMTGPDYRLLLPLSAIGGAIYVLWADTIARTLLKSEIPLGVVTAFIGAPFFAYLLIRHKRAQGGG
jgi:iron complex transport system permease protein